MSEGNWAHPVIKALEIANLQQIIRPNGIDRRRQLYSLAFLKVYTGTEYKAPDTLKMGT
jgi:hypothetical protein